MKQLAIITASFDLFWELEFIPFAEVANLSAHFLNNFSVITCVI